MEIKNLELQEDLPSGDKLQELLVQFENLIRELNNKNLPEQTIEIINNHIENLNSSSLLDNAFRKLLLKKQNLIVKLIENKHKIVPKNYYRNLWMVLGMSAIGLPIGVAIGVSSSNMAFLAIGLPIGMILGLAIGSSMDKKALEEGRQLDIELKSTI